MIYTLAITTTLVFFALSLLHIYWAMGGNWGSASVIPTLNGRPTLNPAPLASLTVAIALTLAATISLAASGLLQLLLPMWLVRLGLIILTVVFAARAIGDFRLIGFTKRVQNTHFAQLDNWVFSPLCFCLAVFCAVLAWFADS